MGCWMSKENEDSTLESFGSFIATIIGAGGGVTWLGYAGVGATGRMGGV